MHHDHFTAIQYTQKLSYALDRKDYDRVDVVLCPPFTDLRSVQTTVEADRIPILLGAQNCFWEKEGAFTGEVSPLMLAKLNVKFVIVGHSERRELFGETDDAVNRKVRAVLAGEMTPIVCVGETLEEREAGWDRRQGARPSRGGVRRGVQGQGRGLRHRVRTDLGDRHRAQRDARRRRGHHRGDPRGCRGCGRRTPRGSRCGSSNGGSVKPGNIAELMARPGIDGALVGGASLEPDDVARNHPGFPTERP